MIKLIAAPAIFIMSRLDLKHKLLLLGITTLAPLLILSYHFTLLLKSPIDTTAYPQDSLDLILFLTLSSGLLVFLLIGQYYQAKNTFLNSSTQINKMNLSSHHQEYLPLLNIIMQEKIIAQRKLEQVMAAVSEVNSAAELLVNLAENTVEGSQQQGQAVNSIASAIEQMSASLNHVEEQAAATQASSNHSSQLAVEGESVSQQAVQDIQNIVVSVDESNALISSLGDRSQQIDSIIHVIESISEQTNLLALNAAIEAARAGEHGRGFAVVADEVRSLATRSHGAATEVAEQIKNIQSEIQSTVTAMGKVTASVESGVDLINRSSESLQAIKQGSIETTDMFSRINIAINEQGEVSKSIASNIENINQQAQQQTDIINNVEYSAEYLVSLAKRAKETSA